jgi:histone H3/H4
MEITRPSITRLARRAGIKSVSEECFPSIRALISQHIDNIVRNALIINSEHQTKTLMPDDIYDALSLIGENLAQSNELGTNTITK